MSKFIENKIDLSVPIEGVVRTTLSTISYESDISKEIITVNIGMKTDLGSIPRALRSVYPNDGKAMFGYILHDYLYREGKYSRTMSDDILEEAMNVLGSGYFTRKSIRLGVRLSGWSAWNRHRKND